MFLKACFFLENLRTATTRTEAFFSPTGVCRDAGFLGYWLIAAIAFTCHFSFIVISPLIFMEQLQLSPYEFSLTLLLYGVAYIIRRHCCSSPRGRIARQHTDHCRSWPDLLLGLVMLMLRNCSGFKPDDADPDDRLHRRHHHRPAGRDLESHGDISRTWPAPRRRPGTRWYSSSAE